jgi:HAMP domain-containing protein
MISALDTHETVKSLMAAGFTDLQAEAVTGALKRTVDIDFANLATKVDLAMLRGEFEVLRGEFGALPSEFEGLRGDFEGLRGEFGALRGEFGTLRGEFGTLRGEFGTLRGEFAVLRGEFAALRGEFGALRGEVDAKIERAKTELVKWVVGMGFAQVAMLVALLRLIPGAHP